MQHVDAHGLEYGSTRGTRGFEVYNNTIRNTGDPSSSGILIRGGDGLIHGNTLGPGINNAIVLSNRTDGSGDCNYPNQDQTTLLYVWGNTDDGAPVGVTVRSGHECVFEEGRDYFHEEMAGYAPYPYPHPLLGGSGGGAGAAGAAGASGQSGGAGSDGGGEGGSGATAGNGGFAGSSGGSGGVSGGSGGDAIGGSGGVAGTSNAGIPMEEGEGCACRQTRGARPPWAVALAIAVLGLLGLRSKVIA